MSLLRTIAVGTVGLILSGMALTAHAADAPRGKATVTTEVAPGTDAFAKDQNQWGAQSTRRSLQWDDKARWGVKLDLTQPSSRDMQLKDIQAGAYYRLSPPCASAVLWHWATQPNLIATPCRKIARRAFA